MLVSMSGSLFSVKSDWLGGRAPSNDLDVFVYLLQSLNLKNLSGSN